MNDENYKIKLKVNEVEIEVAGNQKFTESKFNELENKYICGDGAIDLNIKKSQEMQSKTKLSIIDFVDKKQPKLTATELMPVLVYYYKHFDGINKFNEENIKELYRRYDISKRPKNIYQAILDINRNKGYFESIPKEKGYFRLTESGEHFVEVKLSKNN